MHGAIWVADAGAGTVTAYDARTLAVTGAQDVPGAGALCAWRGDVLCATQAEECIVRLDGASMEIVQRMPVGPGIRAIRAAPDERTLYALSSDADSLMMIDGTTGALLMLTDAGVQPRDLALDGSGQLIAVAGGAACCVYVLRADTLAPVLRIPVEGVAVGVAFAPDALWVLCAVGQEELGTSVLRVRVGDGHIERRLDMEGMPGGLIASPDDGVLIGLLDGMAYVAKHAKRVGWRIALDGALPDVAARHGKQVLWSDGLGGRVWLLDLARGKMRVCLPDLVEPSGVLLTLHASPV